MEKSVLPDTDVLIDFLRGHAKAIALVRSSEDRLILSAIVVSELYAGVRGTKEETVLDEFVALFKVLPVSAEIARAGGLLKRDFGRSHGVGLADALLAATALSENAELKTLNTRHYPMIQGLRAAYTK
jgi:predicted nucleic acid-binding protein